MSGTEASELKADRCTGHCCKEFQLPWDPASLAAALLKHRAGTEKIQDMEQIAAMVIYHGPVASHHAVHDLKGQKFHNWTCRHFDKSKRLCTIYPTRPNMCRKHGTDYPCATQGCTMTTAKRDPERLGQVYPKETP